MKNLLKNTFLLIGIIMVFLGNAISLKLSAQNSTNAEEIIQSSFAKISENYANESQTLNFFYRETIQEDNKYAQLSEVTGNLKYSAYHLPLQTTQAMHAYQVGDFYNTNFIGSRWYNTLTQPEDQALVQASRQSQTLFKHNIGQEITGGPLGLTAYDKVKYPSLFFTASNRNTKTTELNKDYQFELKGQKTFRGYQVYEIAFKPAKINKNQVGFQGVIYVEQNSLALVRFEYAQVVTQNLNIYRADKEEFVHPKHQVVLEYAQTNNKWNLSHIEVIDEVIWQNTKTKQMIANYTTTSELWIQDITSEETVYFSDSKLLPNTLQSSLRNVQDTYKVEFWNWLESSEKYPKLGENIRKDLENNIALEIQFKSTPETWTTAGLSTK
jgi:uncharacterized protein YegJ (DUF2314 family)